MRDLFYKSFKPCGEVIDEKLLTLEKTKEISKVFLGQCKRVYGKFPLGATIQVRLNSSIYEVCILFDTQDKEAVAFATKCKSSTIMKWDELALAELSKILLL